MLCEKCKKNEASVFYRENINGKERKYSLCPECAAELEKNGEIKFSEFPHLSDMNDFAPFGDFGSLNSIFGSLFSPESRRSGRISSGKKCPLCGATFNELAAEGRVGCPECYNTFADELEKTICDIHQNAVHTGRAPKKLSGKLDVKRRIRSLEGELKDAIKDERYERAAQIRDEINGLRGQ